MTREEFTRLQLEEMKRHKWIESEKAGHDLGQQAILDWVDRYAAGFRDHVRRLSGERIEEGAA